MAEIILDREREIQSIMCTKTSKPFYKCSLFSNPDKDGVAPELVNYDKIGHININGEANIKNVYIYSEGVRVLFDKPKYCTHGKYEGSEEYFIRCEE